MTAYRGTGIWTVETGCKYDGCMDIETLGTYDNEAAAREHAKIVTDREIIASDSVREVRAYELRVPAEPMSTVPELNEEGFAPGYGDGWRNLL